MNKTAVALAADSAMTVSANKKQKIYNSANKLFSLSTECPVGIMIYGNAEINRVPWETIIKIYKNKFFKPKRETLKDYANDFITFLSDVNGSMYASTFPDEHQGYSFGFLIFNVFSKISNSIIKAMKSLNKEQGGADNTIKEEITKETIKRFLDNYSGLPDLDGMTEADGLDVVRKYSEIIQLVKSETFKDCNLPEESDNQLTDICSKIVYKDVFIEPSGIVIAGFGEMDVFPSYVDFKIDAVLNNKLKYKKSNSIGIDHLSERSHLMPFAQSNTVSTFVVGIDPTYQEVIHGYMKAVLTESYPRKIIDEIEDLDEIQKVALKEKLENSGEKIYEQFIKEWALSRNQVISIFLH